MSPPRALGHLRYYNVEKIPGKYSFFVVVAVTGGLGASVVVKLFSTNVVPGRTRTKRQREMVIVRRRRVAWCARSCARAAVVRACYSSVRALIDRCGKQHDWAGVRTRAECARATTDDQLGRRTPWEIWTR